MILAEGKAPGRAGFKGQRPLRTVSPPFEQLCLALAPARAPGGAGFKGQRPLRTVSPPFNLCLALIGLASIRDLLPRFGCRRGERSPMISMFVINDEFWCRICAGWNLRWVKQLGGL